MYEFAAINLILGIIVAVVGGGATVITIRFGPHIYIKISGGTIGVILTALAEFWIFTQTFSF